MHEPTESSPSARVEMILQQVDALPTLSPIATKLLSVASADDADLREIVRLIEADPALTAKILGLCRRAACGLGDSVTTVERAVVMLGLDAVQSAVLSVQVYELMAPERAGAAERGMGFDHTGFWRHAIGVACASELLAEENESAGVRPSLAFVSGLLHDLGKLVLDLVLPQAYGRVVALAEHRQCRTAEVERSIIGIDHHTAGKRVAERWGLPPSFRDVIWLHTQPADALRELPHAPLIRLVTAARAVSREQHIGWSGDCALEPPATVQCEQAGLDPATVAAVIPRLHRAVIGRCEALGLEAPDAPDLLLQSIANANRRLARLNHAMDRRSRLSRQQEKVLAAITAFNEEGGGDARLQETLGRVVRSAAELLGEGWFAALHRPRSADPWRVFRFAVDGRVVRTVEIEASAELDAVLARALDPTRVAAGGAGLAAILDELLDESAEAHELRICPLGAPAAGEEGPAVLLVHDRDPGARGLTADSVRALASAWSAAVGAAARHEEAGLLGERLADANRLLAAAHHRLAEARAAARLGEFAAGAAHEMNNPLTIISGRAQMLAGRVRTEEDAAAAAAISAAAEKLSDLITSLHVLAEPRRIDPGPAPVAAFIADAVREAGKRDGGVRRMEIRVPEGVPDAWVDRELLTQAIAEIIINALEASADTKVRIDVQTDPLDDRLEIVVTDRGAGMTEHTLQHAFDPFFSAKPAGRQPGLGLARARRIVELHSGEIVLRSTPNVGTTATVALPHWRATEQRRAA